ncbi:MAG TPA: hypothetical protein VMW28_07235 [Pelolinea sp.]|nr:hypothetical protein [Pelolinea sp.]
MRKIYRLLFIVVIFALVISACGKTDLSDSENAETDVKQEPEFLSWNCENSYVQTGNEIALYYEWQTMTKEQNIEFFDVTKHYVNVNGIPKDIKKQGYGDIMKLSDGTVKQMFWMNIGSLEPGDYEIESVAEITKPVFDGWDWYGPDSDYPSFINYCTVTVGDEPPAEMAKESDPEHEIPDTPEIQAPAIVPCSIESSLKPEWDTFLCETFDASTSLWIGNDQGTTTRLEGGEYLIDNSTKVASGYTTGFIYPVVAGSGQDYMISVDGRMESKYKQCTWGIYVRSTFNEIVYFFMIDNQGVFSLTGSSDNEANRFLGNIKTGSNNAIVWDGVNNISAVVDGKQMEFYVNGKMLVSHEAINAENPVFGLIVWGGEGVSAVNYFDNLLVRTK